MGVVVSLLCLIKCVICDASYCVFFVHSFVYLRNTFLLCWSVGRSIHSFILWTENPLEGIKEQTNKISITQFVFFFPPFLILMIFGGGVFCVEQKGGYDMIRMTEESKRDNLLWIETKIYICRRETRVMNGIQNMAFDVYGIFIGRHQDSINIFR